MIPGRVSRRGAMARSTWIVAMASLSLFSRGTVNAAGGGLVRVPLLARRARRSSSSRHGERRELVDDDHQGGGGGTTHFVQIRVGGPVGQYRTLAVSTNSDWTAFPCTGCDACGHDNRLYDTTSSKSFRATPCGECAADDGNDRCRRAALADATPSSSTDDTCLLSDVDRDESSWGGFEATDVANIGADERTRFPMTFACQTTTKGWFADPEAAGGIIAMSPRPTSFINQMYQAGALPRPAFSLCFGHKILGLVNKDGTTNGALTLGGYDPKYHMTPIVFATNTRVKNSSFSLHLSKIYLRVGGGQQVEPDMKGLKIIPVRFNADIINDEANGGVTLNSGTPFTIFTHHLKKPFMEAWRQAAGEEFSNKKYELTKSQLLLLPTLLLQFRAHHNDGDDRNQRFHNAHLKPRSTPNLAGFQDLDTALPYDVVVAFPATHYMEHNVNNDRYRPRISFDNADGTILGSNMMQGYDVTFDLAHDRIGFAESASCQHVVRKRAGDDGGSGSGSGRGFDTSTLTFDDDLFEQEVGDSVHKKDFDHVSDDLYDDDDAAAGNSGGRRGPSGDHAFVKGVQALSPDGPAACDTLTCRAFVGFGYVAFAVAAWVAYKCATLKGGADGDDERIGEVFGDETEVQRLREVDFPDREPDEEEY